jgi:hypothetical protein
MIKKFLSGSALLAIAAVAGWNVSINSQKSDTSGLSLANMEALAECENSVKFSGSIIVVTVCDRKTPWIAGMLGVSCSENASTSCQFTNVCP